VRRGGREELVDQGGQALGDRGPCNDAIEPRLACSTQCMWLLVGAEPERARRTEQPERVHGIDVLDVADREVGSRRLLARACARDVVAEVPQRHLDARVRKQVGSVNEDAGHAVSVSQRPRATSAP
jgi:hypothetical protein